MSRAQYEQHYQECLAAAREAASAEQRALLLQMAQSWKLLAEKSDTIRDLFQYVTPKGHA